jgi:hypothetical protein
MPPVWKDGTHDIIQEAAEAAAVKADLAATKSDELKVIVDVLTANLAIANSKLDAIQAMLNSTVYGMQKMSSNLDDIMVKLDV